MCIDKIREQKQKSPPSKKKTCIHVQCILYARTKEYVNFAAQQTLIITSSWSADVMMLIRQSFYGL